MPREFPINEVFYILTKSANAKLYCSISMHGQWMVGLVSTHTNSTNICPIWTLVKRQIIYLLVHSRRWLLRGVPSQVTEARLLPRTNQAVCSSQFTEYVSPWSDRSTRGITGLRVPTGQLAEPTRSMS
jgi:hypothetical protein